MNTMIPLRVIALASNVLFMAYGYADHLYPVFFLHAILLPVNALRLVQFYRLVREMRQAPGKDLSVQTLLPYMTRRKFSAGETLVRKGERADRLYYLLDGEIEVVEISKVLHADVMVGEIAVFAPNQQRTATIVCLTDCNMLELTESKTKQLYSQDRSFGFAVLQLIISRLLENNKRLIRAGTAELTDFDVVVNSGAPALQPVL
jgi:CRP-like cAMP-binding protein